MTQLWIDIDQEDEDTTELIPGTPGLHEDFGDITFLEWVDQSEGTLRVTRRNSVIDREVYLDDCIFDEED